MANWIDDSIINDIRHKAKIEEVIGHYIDVIRKGNSYVAMCPFHDDHDPSLHISIDKQIFKCFSCPDHTAGDVFTFVMKYKKIEYLQAVKEVAELVGYEYDFGEIKKTDNFKETVLHKIMVEAVNFTQNELNSVNGNDYRNYLENRKITKEFCEKYQFGYNPSNDRLYNFLNKKGYKDADIIKCGLARLTENGIRDVFYSRLMIPIHDSLGHPIGFTARSLDPNNPSKYINTSETELFSKGKIIFNIHRASESIREKKYAIICEGPMDVIAFDKANLKNAICALGTAFTSEQLEALRKLTSTLVLSFDGDLAGQGAIFKTAKLAQNYNFKIQVINNQTKLDPDEIINKYSASELVNMVEKPLEWIEWVFNYYKSKYDLNNYTDKKVFVQKVLDEINGLTDNFDKENWVQELIKLTGFAPDLINREVKEEKKVKPERKIVQLHTRLTGLQIAQGTIVKQMLNSYNATNIYKNELGMLYDTDLNRLATAIIDEYRSYDTINVADFMGRLEDPILKELLFTISEDEVYNGNSDEKVLTDAIRHVKMQKLKQEEQEIRKLQQTVTDPVVIGKYEQQIRELKKKMREE